MEMSELIMVDDSCRGAGVTKLDYYSVKIDSVSCHSALDAESRGQRTGFGAFVGITPRNTDVMRYYSVL